MEFFASCAQLPEFALYVLRAMLDRSCVAPGQMSASLIEALDNEEVPDDEGQEVADWVRLFCSRRDDFELCALAFDRAVGRRFTS